MTRIVPTLLSLLVLPAPASAMTLVQALSVFHLFVGVYLVATLMVFAIGIGVYVARFNTWPSHRDTAIYVMEWGVAMLFVLIALLGIVQFFERHPTIALRILAFALIVVVLYYVLRAAATSKPKKKAPAARAREP